MNNLVARLIRVEGVVQGVGFRPFVHGAALRHDLAGGVRNTASGVEIEIEGEPAAIGGFLRELGERPPPLAWIERIEAVEIPARGVEGFAIEASTDGGGFQPVSPDVAACSACLDDVDDPSGRRYRYPFTTCTSCGARFTIIQRIPYDRANTTMAGFTMCAECRAEYHDPADRRFHAEANACPICGPRLSLVDPAGRSIAADPLEGTRRLLREGRIVAIKGIGGFHLACDATSETAVERLRRRKQREAKPFALMVADVASAERICKFGEEERRLLESPVRPIVLLRAREGSSIARAVARPLRDLGVMLPYTPLHHLLFSPSGNFPQALVLTSGNRSSEPIVTEGAEALVRLGAIADAFVLHDRPIAVRCDDSVTRMAPGGELPLRRSRGYAPFPVRLRDSGPPILACGADFKNAVCLTRGRYAFLSPHVGDLGEADTYGAYAAMISRMEALFRVRPEAVAHDLHPDYFSTRFALALDPGLPRLAIQHHHAHVAACMAEHGLSGPVIGVAFDGTGYGGDGSIWGGEFLVVDYASFRRAGHLGTVAMPGGARAIREPFRMALAHVLAACGSLARFSPEHFGAREEEFAAVDWQVRSGVNAPLTSSVGRLFDAVASLAGVRHRALYEGQAAMELEAVVADGAHGFYPMPITSEDPAIADPRPLIAAIVRDLERGVGAGVIAARFHAAVARMAGDLCVRIRGGTGIRQVVLSGGVFQNVTLLEQVLEMLSRRGFEVFRHQAVPPNDGGIALGQAAIARARLAA